MNYTPPHHLQSSHSSMASSQSKTKVKKTARQIRMGIMSNNQSNQGSHLSSPNKNCLAQLNNTPYTLKTQYLDPVNQQHLPSNIPTYQSRAIASNSSSMCQGDAYTFTRVQLLYPCDQDFTRKFKQLLDQHDIKIVQIVNDSQHS